MQNAGFIVHGADSQYIYIEEPSCILRGFVSFAEYAWIAIVCVTILLLFGWGISMIRGSKNDIFMNLRNLMLIFGIVSAAAPIINVLFGDDLFARGCKTEKIYISDVQELLAARDAKLKSKNSNNPYEEIDIYDTGPDKDTWPIDDTTTPAIEIPPVDDDTPTPQPTPEDPTPERPPVSKGNRAIKAHGDGKHTLYTYPNQSKIRRQKGTPAWRNNNPGNIVSGKFTNGAGGIGKSGRFGVFPDEQTGMDAIVKLLKTSTYQQKTLAGAIHSWAPPSDGNNTSSYQHQVSQATGVSLDTPLNRLNDNQLREIAKIIRKIEGWNPGTETRE